MKQEIIKNKFPFFKKSIKNYAYLDNASTTQKPQSVLDQLDFFYTELNSNVHRGIYPLSEKATEYYEGTREKVGKFINASKREEIIFTKSATEAINLVAYTWGEQNIKAGDEILVSILEHHSNFVPWQQLAKRKEAILKVVMCDSSGRITAAQVKKQLSKKTKLVAITHFSNVTGTILPIAEIIKEAHRVGALALVDAAQSAAHIPIDVQKLNCDWLVFSGHKIYGPTGIGILYGKKALLEALPPLIYGGHMIEEVTREKTTYAPLPEKFEGGTQPVAEVIGLGAALSFIRGIGFAAIQKHERTLVSHMLKGLKGISGLTLLGSAKSADRIPVFSFTLHGIHPHDLATLLDKEGIAVRAGHHCAEILHSSLTPDASIRMSLGIYNTVEEIDRAITALSAIQRKWRI